MNIYILSNDGGALKATKCLDEATIWKIKGGNVREVELSDGEQLAPYLTDEGNIFVQNEEGEHLASAFVEIDNEPHEHLLHDCSVSHYTSNFVVKGIFFEFPYGKTVSLEKANLTKELSSEIEDLAEALKNHYSEHIL